MPHSRVTVATIALSLCCLITALAMGLDLSGFSVRAFGSASDLASRISFKPTIAEDGQPRDKQPLENSLGFSTVSKKSVQPDSLLYLHVPLLTYGLQKGLPGLPNGDLFKLVDELHYEGNAPDGIKAGHLNSGSFGDIPVPYAVKEQ